MLVPLSLVMFEVRLRRRGGVELADCWKVVLRHPGTVDLAAV